MPTKCEIVAEALRDLAKAINGVGSPNQKLSEAVGWTAPPLSRSDIAEMATNLANRIEKIPDASIANDWDPSEDVSKITFVKNSVIPNLFNGNGVAAYFSYQGMIVYFENSYRDLIPNLIDWEKIEGEQLVPNVLARRVRALKSRIDTIYSGAERLAEQVDGINKAHDAALSLPTDLDSLTEARDRVEKVEADALKRAKAVNDASMAASVDAGLARGFAAEAEKLVENTADAYRAATTKGLSESFQVRADDTANSMWIWVGGLVIALGLGAWLGGHRLGLVQQLLEKNASPAMVTINLFLAAFSIAAPVWFAWIATKQIGHRFRLSEDYAFKASVAKAYEGYRREAARIDDKFAARLFSSALDRLEEAPLRFVETETFGSPWHEVMQLRAQREAKKAQVAADRASAAAAAAKLDDAGKGEE